MKRFALLFISVAFMIPQGLKANDPPEYLPGYVTIKTESSIEQLRSKSSSDSDFNRWLREYSASHRAVLPDGYAERHRRINTDTTGDIAERLSRTYHIKLRNNDDPLRVARKAEQMSEVVYAEPRYNYQVLDDHIPNDSMIGEDGHDYFEYHRIFDAWQITRSSSGTVIAIIDTGVYYDHPELKNKLWRNPEPGRASEVFPEVENDTIGWNFWQSGDVFAGEEPEQNADPIGDYSDHGTFVAGIAAAEPDNGEEIAGTGYYAQYMPVKAGGTQKHPGSVAFGIDGILYAALNEADVINASFGSPNYSHYARDIIRMANDMGSLVVAASGNEGNDEPFYPAAYPEVLSVGAVNNNYEDRLTTFSTFGYTVDMYAIGHRIYSTSFDYDEENISWSPDYRRTSGTSMAAPVVAGIAALLRDYNPGWSPDRVRMQLRNSSESIRDANSSRNPYHLGQGRLNAFRALDDPQPGLELTSFDPVFTNEREQKLDVGEHGKVELELINHGEAISEVSFSSSQQQDGFEITEDGSAQVGDGAFRSSLPVRLAGNFNLIRYPESIVTYRSSDGEYEDFALLRFEDFYYDQAESSGISASISSDGGLGFRFEDGFRQGNGILPEGFESSIVEEAGLMLSLFDGNRTHFIDAVRAEGSVNDHFKAESLFRNREGDHSARFTSATHPRYSEVEVDLSVHPRQESGNDNTMILEYKLTNVSDETWYNVYAGIFSDWSLSDETHVADYIDSDSLHYVYDKSEEIYATFSHLGPVSSALAIDNLSEMTLAQANNRSDSLSFGTFYNPQEGRWDGFTVDEKRLAFTAGTERTSIDTEDIGTVSSSGPFTVESGESITLGFVLGWAEDLESLQSQVAAARSSAPFDTPGKNHPVSASEEMITDVPEETELSPGYPNPFNNITNFSLNLAQDDDVTIRVYDITGRNIKTLANEHLESGKHQFTFDAGGLASGVYIIVAHTHIGTLTRNVTLVK